MILRIENTDLTNVYKHCITTMETLLQRFGVEFNESPLRPGYFGPYLQSDRNHIHQFYGNIIKAQNQGFVCNCSFRRIEALKRVNLALGEAAVYDGKCIKRHVGNGKLRLKVPRCGHFNNNGRITK